MLTHRSVCPPAVYRNPWHEAKGEGVMCHGRKCKSADESEIKGGERLNRTFLGKHTDISHFN